MSKLFETSSIDRGSTLVHRHILKVSWFSFYWLVGRIKSKKSRKSRYPSWKSSLYKESYLALTLILW